MIKKMLLAAAAVMTLAAPVAASAQEFYGYDHDRGYGYGQDYRDRYEHDRFEQRRFFAFRRLERERELRREFWRSHVEHRYDRWY
jgi:hypothetical protein